MSRSTRRKSGVKRSRDDYGMVAPAPARAARPWATRQRLAAFAVALAALVLAWRLFFPEEFHYATDTVKGWFRSDAKADEESEVAEINKAPAPASAPEGMVRVPGGRFWMGSE